jgi:hypothetical protein
MYVATQALVNVGENYIAVGMLALIGILSVVLAVATKRKRR